MTKKLIIPLLIPFLLCSCISITKYPAASVHQQDFVTATLAATATRWIATVSTLTPETASTGLVSTASASANCTDAAILLRDVTIPDHTSEKW